jgi:hypothetical protein
MGNFEVSECPSAYGMYNSLRDTLAVKLGKFINEVKVSK